MKISSLNQTDNHNRDPNFFLFTIAQHFTEGNLLNFIIFYWNWIFAALLLCSQILVSISLAGKWIWINLMRMVYTSCVVERDIHQVSFRTPKLRTYQVSGDPRSHAWPWSAVFRYSSLLNRSSDNQVIHIHLYYDKFYLTGHRWIANRYTTLSWAVKFKTLPQNMLKTTVIS